VGPQQPLHRSSPSPSGLLDSGRDDSNRRAARSVGEDRPAPLSNSRSSTGTTPGSPEDGRNGVEDVLGSIDHPLGRAMVEELPEVAGGIQAPGPTLTDSTGQRIAPSSPSTPAHQPTAQSTTPSMRCPQSLSRSASGKEERSHSSGWLASSPVPYKRPHHDRRPHAGAADGMRTHAFPIDSCHPQAER
jgi:hypothetical protein